MALSVVDLYRDVLPRTNCGDCGFPTCLAFAGMVVSDKHPIGGCPHLAADTVKQCQEELQAQYAAGKWTKRDLAADALAWAKQRSASMDIEALPNRIGGELITVDGKPALKLPYFDGSVIIDQDDIASADGSELTRWEKVFIYNHLAQGGSRKPTHKWKGFEEFPNTVSKIKSMIGHVEEPLVERFKGRLAELVATALALGAKEMTGKANSADATLFFQPFPRVPVKLLFWDEDPRDEFGATAKLLFDETVLDHLDIESIVFLSERLRQLLCETADRMASKA